MDAPHFSFPPLDNLFPPDVNENDGTFHVTPDAARSLVLVLSQTRSYLEVQYTRCGMVEESDGGLGDTE